MTIRMLGKWSNAGQAPTYWGATGVAYSGWVIDAGPSDVLALTAAGWTPIAGVNGNQAALPPAQSGSTKSRPLPGAVAAGQTYVDTSLGAVVVWDGAYWRNPLDGMLA